MIKRPGSAAYIVDPGIFLLPRAFALHRMARYDKIIGSLFQRREKNAVRQVVYYFLAVSLIGAVVCVYDKLAAGRGWGRVPERTLFFWALVGGGPGVYPTMLLIRHKTLHKRFMLGIPAVMLVQAGILAGLYHILHMRGTI